ncbi:MAG: sigma-54 dependent transcriptional regulator [Acidibacter sp.]|jgi:two-component system response regulator FlrC|nr:sigma-54 dependent transcriptional regulator [Acidibacter sp.]
MNNANVHAEAAAGSVVYGDPFTAQLLALASRVARTDVTVLIGGPSGTGKEVLARYIHETSLRSTGPFVAFNCACLPESMVEDLLFGHEKGAFTGAVQRFHGYFEQADGGTLFLDEVGELPPNVQAKLLRVLQEREFTPLGSTKPQKTQFRLLAATNRNLKGDVATGRFREDLYYRLNIFPLQLKPLRERPGDIIPLARAMVNKHQYISGAMQLDDSAIAALRAYDWPGNVRELENVIQRAMVIADGSLLRAEHLGLDTGLPVENNFIPMALPISDLPSSIDEEAGATTESLADWRIAQEAELIIATLRDTPTKMAAAAKLGISERTLRYKLARLRDSGMMMVGA